MIKVTFRDVYQRICSIPFDQNVIERFMKNGRLMCVCERPVPIARNSLEFGRLDLSCVFSMCDGWFVRERESKRI